MKAALRHAHDYSGSRRNFAAKVREQVLILQLKIDFPGKGFFSCLELKIES
jgi:hypothetical protein